MADTGQDRTTVDVETLYRREHRRIRAICFAILRDEADADDATQETFARIAPRLALLDGDVVGYLVVVARNVCRAELRRRARAARQGDDSAVAETPEDTALQRSVLQSVWRCLASAEQALLCYVFSGMSTAEIGERTGTSSNVAAQRVSRLRRRIRHMMAAPAALLAPMLHGSAMGRAVASRAAALVAPVLDRIAGAQRALDPVLAGIAAGVLLLPQSVTHGAAYAGGPPATASRPAALAPALPVAQHLLLPTAAPSLHAPAPVRAAVAAMIAKVHAAPPPDATFLSFTPSPHYASDHVIFATADGSGCMQPPCTGVWRSDNSGATWKPLHNAPGGSVYSHVELPPNWPADPVIFIDGGNGIERSDNGGVSFRTVYTTVATGSSEALDPASSPGDARVLIAGDASGPLVYSEADDRVHLLTGVPPGSFTLNLFAAPGGSAAYIESDASVGQGLYACPGPGTTCSYAGPDPVGPPMAESPTYRTDHTYFIQGYDLEVGVLEKGIVAHIPVPGQLFAVLPALDYAHSHVLEVVRNDHGVANPVRFVDGVEQPWALHVLPDIDYTTLTRLPDGHLLAALTHSDPQHTSSGGGTLCSVDDGVSWNPHC